MGYNLYSLTEEKLNQLCIECLFDRKTTKIVKMIILEDKPIKIIAYDLEVSEQAIYMRIAKIKQKLKIKKWTDSLN